MKENTVKDVELLASFIITEKLRYIAPDCAMYYLHALLILGCFITIIFYVLIGEYLGALLFYFLTGFPMTYAETYLPSSTTKYEWSNTGKWEDKTGEAFNSVKERQKEMQSE